MATLHADASTELGARERSTWQEICARHPDEWVVLIDLEWENGDEDNGDVVSAVVLGHSKSRADCLRETKAARDREQIMQYAHFYTGAIIQRPFVSLSFQ